MLAFLLSTFPFLKGGQPKKKKRGKSGIMMYFQCLSVTETWLVGKHWPESAEVASMATEHQTGFILMVCGLQS